MAVPFQGLFTVKTLLFKNQLLGKARRIHNDSCRVRVLAGGTPRRPQTVWGTRDQFSKQPFPGRLVVLPCGSRPCAIITMEETNNFKTPSRWCEKRKSAWCLSPCVNIPASPFMQRLGCGTGVSVYLMKRSPRGLSHSPWAVKKINPRCNDVYQSMYLKRLTDEAKNLKSPNHPSVIAFTEAGDGCLSCFGIWRWIVSEWLNRRTK